MCWLITYFPKIIIIKYNNINTIEYHILKCIFYICIHSYIVCIYLYIKVSPQLNPWFTDVLLSLEQFYNLAVLQHSFFYLWSVSWHNSYCTTINKWIRHKMRRIKRLCSYSSFLRKTQESEKIWADFLPEDLSHSSGKYLSSVTFKLGLWA